MHHDMTFNFSSAKVCSPAIFETCFSATDFYIFLHNRLLSISSYSPINKFYSFIFVSLPINAVILLLNCLVLIPYLYIHFLSLRHYFLYLTLFGP